MQSPHYRKVELQSPADLTYLYTNTVALSRQKLDLHFPPSASYSEGDEPDPMKERVKELVDQFIRQTYTYASDSISVNGLEFDSSTAATSEGGPFPFPSAFSAPDETVEYEAYDSDLASRVSSLYAQLESLTTTVAQLRRDAPGKAAKTFADRLNEVLNTEDAEFKSEEENIQYQYQYQNGQQVNGKDQDGDTKMDIENEKASGGSSTTAASLNQIKPEWKLNVPFGTEPERERWQSGEMAEIYTDTVRTLLRLQGEEMELEAGANVTMTGEDDYTNYNDNDTNNNKAISTTVATAERAEKAAEVVDKM